jgi:uncharacterized protein DUF4340
MRRLVNMLVLVVLLAGLGAYIYFVDSKRPASGGLAEKEKVFTVEADKLEELTVTSGSETTTLRKVDGAWRITAPVQAEADQSAVSSLTSGLSSLEINRVVDENAANLGEYGLAKPRITVSYKAAGGGGGQLQLGDKTATQSDLYAVKDGGKRVFLVQAFQESTFDKKPFDLREKRILHFERDKVDSVEIAQDGSPIQLVRSGSDWVVKQPVQARGDYSAIEGLLTRLSSAGMTKLVDLQVDPATLAKYGLDKPVATLTLGAGSTRATLAVGKEEEGAVYARDLTRQMIFAIEPGLVTDLKKPASDFRDKDLFEFRNFNLDRLRVVRGADTYEFQKVMKKGENAGEQWQRVAGSATTDIDTGKMDDFLSKLTALRAESFVTTALDKPILVVSASYDGGKFERVRFSRGTEAVAARDGEGGTARLSASPYDETIKSFEALIAPPPPPPAK